MILLDSTLRKLQVVLAAAKATNDCSWISAYGDVTNVASSVPVASNGNSSNGTTNGTTAVDVVVAPGSSQTRRLLDFKLVNTDTSPITVTLNYNDNGTSRALWTGALNVGDTLQYNVNKDFTVTDSNGNTKTVQGAPAFSAASMPGRLSLSSTIAAPTSDIVAASSVYYVSILYALGFYVPVYNGSSFAGFSISGLAALTLNTSNHLSGKNYDVFAIVSSGTLTLVTGPAWTSLTARSTALSQTVGNIETNATLMTAYNGATSYSVAANQGTFLGSIYCTANGQTTVRFGASAAAGGSNPLCGLSNAYNQVLGGFMNLDSNANWAYTTGAWRQKDNNANNQFNFLYCQAQGNALTGTMMVRCGNSNSTATNVYIGMGLDSASSPSGVTTAILTYASTNATGVHQFTVPATMGYHYLAELEYSVAVATSTWVGSGASVTFYNFWY